MCRLEWEIRLTKYSGFYKDVMRSKSKGGKKYLYRFIKLRDEATC